MIKILCIGEEWRGSNASGLFYALSRSGYVIHVINELSYVSVKASSSITKSVNWFSRAFQVDDFNDQLIRSVTNFKPDLIIVYKGAFVKPASIQHWKMARIPVIIFFPDVSFLAHGKLIPQCVPLYDHIFTTKTFGKDDIAKNFGVAAEKISFIPHGFDPQIHRPLQDAANTFACEASFIGNHSRHKQAYLEYVAGKLPALRLKIWGSTWQKKGLLAHGIQSVAVEGDQYALALHQSMINIALLSEKVSGASRGDQITSRTFHIPAAGGFMLHQRTEEVALYFEEGKEMACFDSMEELTDKIQYYQTHSSEREKIRESGYLRAISEHSLDKRAVKMMQVLKERGLLI